MSLASGLDEMTFTDVFCGAGGSSIGLEGAGFELKLAANHWARAIETHSANFPGAEHLLADVSNYDMRRLPRTRIAWFSPICTENSPAGGRRRRPKGQLDWLEEHGHVSRDGMERTRATFHDVIRAAEVHRYDAVIVENVTEAADWELFDWWVDGMKMLGYNCQFVSVSSAHVGGEGNPHAPQWRDRLYIVFTRTGIPQPGVSPKPLAWCGACEEVVEAFQSWKRPERCTIGKYGRQYVYRCPSMKCRHAVAEPFVLPAASAIDWTDLGTRIGDRKRPIAVNTRRRVRAGLDMFAQPVTVAVGGNTWERPGSGYVRAWPTLDAPMGARSCTNEQALATPDGTFLTLLRSGRVRNSDPGDEPLAAIMASGSNHGLVVPLGGYNRKDGPTTTGEPLRTLVVPFRGKRSKATTTAEPLHTMATRDSAALVQPDDSEVDECRLRMLKPREHLRAQRFPDSYIVTGNQGEQTMQAGNAVSSNVAQWLGRAIAAVLQ